jgi:hypothetical protein
VFGIVFTFANYPLLGAGIVLVTLVAIAYSERRRRANRRASESARRRDRLQWGELPGLLDPPDEPHGDATTLSRAGEDSTVR